MSAQCCSCRATRAVITSYTGISGVVRAIREIVRDCPIECEGVFMTKEYRLSWILMDERGENTWVLEFSLQSQRKPSLSPFYAQETT